MKQTTNSILMIRPVSFRMNEQTAVNNYYQKKLDNSAENINKKAQEEFDGFVDKLRAKGVNVTVVEDTLEPNTPDSIFPNNWISFHENKEIVLYPMFAENRRLERREDILEILDEKGFDIEGYIDFTKFEEQDVFLEGTGSMILDRANRKAYCALSPRADEELFINFCEVLEYTPVVFTANQTVGGRREAIYHTNVMMCVAEDFAVICLDSIDDKKERKEVVNQLKSDGKKIIDISEEQVNQFAGNMLQVRGKDELFLVMSSTAYHSLTKEQLNSINESCKIIHSDISTIEICGGGSARCMMAEIFNPLK